MDQVTIEDPISAEALRFGIADTFNRALPHWSTLDPFEWAENVRRLPDEHGATKAFTFNYAPYEREMYAECFEPRNQEVVFQIYSRGGKSEVVLNVLGYRIHQLPCRIGVLWPTLGQGKKWSKADFTGTLIDPTPELSTLIGNATGQRRSNNTLLHKIFAGGLIDIVGANAPGDLRRLKASVLYCDEIDAIEEIKSDEGDQLAIMKKRGAEFADTIEIYCSYPSLKRRSRIEAKLLESDFRQWYVPCLKCGFDRWAMHRRDIRYDREKPAGARLECPNCHDFHDDKARYAMSRLPKKWTPTRPFRGKAGFQANAMLWPHPVDPQKFPGGYLQMVAQEEIDADNSDNPERSRRVLVNTVDAETFEAEFEHKPDHSALFLRREDYDPYKVLPAGVLAIFFFVDVQGDRLELFIDGFGFKNQIWALDYQVIKGTPLAPPDQGCWAELDRILTTAKFPHPSGKYLSIRGGLIDCGYKPDNVFAFTRPRRSRKIYASRGATTLGRPIIGRRPRKQGNPSAKVWELGTNEAKDIIYQRLDLDNAAANGYQHFPKTGPFSERYFAMLTSEESEMRRAGDGKFYRWFATPDKQTRNEALDGRVGTMAAEKIAKIKYDRIVRELYGEKGEASAPSSESPAGVTAPAAPEPSSSSPAAADEPSSSSPGPAAPNKKKKRDPFRKPFGKMGGHPGGKRNFVQGWRTR